MPRYYFHLINDVDVPDNEGQTFADAAAARAFAIGQARALIAATTVEDGRIVLHHRIDIEDEDHAVVDKVHFRDAVMVEA
jgi:hypothetical protein